MGIGAAWYVSLCADEEGSGNEDGNGEVEEAGGGDGASGSGASIGLSSRDRDDGRAAEWEWENWGIAALLASAGVWLCSFWGWAYDCACEVGAVARPDARAMEVCMQRRNGELCITTRCLRFRFWAGWLEGGATGSVGEVDGEVG